MKILGARSVLKCGYFLHTLLQQKRHGRHNHGSGSLIDTKGGAGKFWKEGRDGKGELLTSLPRSKLLYQMPQCVILNEK